MENQTENNQNKESFFQSTTAKMMMVGLLTLALLIPLQFVKELITERSQRKQEVVNEVAELWGKDIIFYGPMMKVPYRTYEEYNVTNPKTGVVTIERKAILSHAYFFPEKLNNKSDIKKNTSLKRGIYNNVVFTANMSFDGSFSAPNIEKLEIKDEDILWEKASILIKTTNLKSIKSDLNITLNNEKLTFESKPEEKETFYGTLETSSFNYKTLVQNGKLNFNFLMQYNGSNSVKFIPVGKTTVVNIDSDLGITKLIGGLGSK